MIQGLHRGNALGLGKSFIQKEILIEREIRETIPETQCSKTMICLEVQIVVTVFDLQTQTVAWPWVIEENHCIQERIILSVNMVTWIGLQENQAVELEH